jgi:hypothetical protein
MRLHDATIGRGRVALLLAPALLAVALTGALGVPVAGASSHQSSKAVLAAARAHLIEKSQLAGKWTASSYGSGSSGGGPGSSGGSGNSINGSVCASVSEPGVDQSPYFVESDYYDQKGTSAELQEEIDVYPNATQATKDVEFTTTSAFQSCYLSDFSQSKNSIAAGIGKGATIGTITIAPVSIGKFGQKSAEFRLVIPINYQGATVDLDYDYVAIAEGKYEAELDESNLAAPLPTKIATNFQQAVVKDLKGG